MLKIENVQTMGWEPALRGMRNPMNSWDRADTVFLDGSTPDIGLNDIGLMLSLAAGGSVHAKYRRMIVVYCDVTAPMYWWKQMDTYRVGQEKNSCSTMHKIQAKPFVLEDFSTDGLSETGLKALGDTISILEQARLDYQETHNPEKWRDMILLLPSCYNQRRTLMLNYENLSAMYRDRKNHKLTEWHMFCEWIEQLPYSEIIV